MKTRILVICYAILTGAVNAAIPLLKLEKYNLEVRGADKRQVTQGKTIIEGELNLSNIRPLPAGNQLSVRCKRLVIPDDGSALTCEGIDHFRLNEGVHRPKAKEGKLLINANGSIESIGSWKVIFP
jgi:hypothetical protein